MKKKTIIAIITVALICASVIAIRAISDKNENGWNGEYSEEETTVCETTSEKAPKPDKSSNEEEKEESAFLSDLIFEEKDFKPGWLKEKAEIAGLRSISELPATDFRMLWYSYMLSIPGMSMMASPYLCEINTIQAVIEDGNYHYLVDCLKFIDDEHILVPFKVVIKENTENSDPVFMFAVFEREIDDCGHELWRSKKEAYYISELKSKDDFASLSVGDTLDELVKIDRSFGYDAYTNYDRSNLSGTKKLIKPLNDGFIIIEMNKNDTVIISIDFYPADSEILSDTMPVGLDDILMFFDDFTMLDRNKPET